ncbi:Uncharacterised protein [Mycobacterium tuberculosis]|nr:Uncharacterised protein [Mycobacterium tuberculosis]
MVAVVSNTPSSISAADMTSVRPLWIIELFRVVTRNPAGSPNPESFPGEKV